MQSLDIFEQITQVLFNDTPHYSVVNGIVTMCENIPERYNVAIISYIITFSRRHSEVIRPVRNPQTSYHAQIGK